MLKMESYSGVIRPKDESGKFTINVPEERRPEQSRLEVRYSPTLAGAMVDALPYLVDYPYGCTEQTLNRFLPTVITQKVLLDMELDLKDIQQEADQPQRPGDRRRRGAGEAVEALRPQPGLRRGRSAQHGQGRRRAAHRDAAVPTAAGAGSPAGASTPRRTPRPWWSTACRSPSRTTWPWCPACWSAASSGSSAIRTSRCSCIKNAAIKDKPAGTCAGRSMPTTSTPSSTWCWSTRGVKNADMREFLYRDRTKLAVYGMAMYGLALEKQGEKEKLDMILRNIGQYVEQDDENQTAWLNLPERLLVVLVRQRVRGPRLLSEAAGEDRSEGRAGPAAGQVPAEQPQARHLLELDPRHGPVHRGVGRLHPRQRRGPSRR